MTTNQIAFAQLQEAKRANLRKEGQEDSRISEVNRHNLATEHQAMLDFGETSRSNQARENETQRHNIINEQESRRHNVTTEQETERDNRARVAAQNVQTIVSDRTRNRELDQQGTRYDFQNAYDLARTTQEGAKLDEIQSVIELNNARRLNELASAASKLQSAQLAPYELIGNLIPKLPSMRLNTGGSNYEGQQNKERQLTQPKRSQQYFPGL